MCFCLDFYCFEGYHFHDKGEDCSSHSKCHSNSNKRREGENLVLNMFLLNDRVQNTALVLVDILINNFPVKCLNVPGIRRQT